MSRPCVCGCGKRGVQQHHVVYVQHLRAIAGRDHDRQLVLGIDPRNLVRIAPACHQAHHRGYPRLTLAMLPDSAYEFAREVYGPGAAYEYLRRRYNGKDPRLNALLAEAAVA